MVIINLQLRELWTFSTFFFHFSLSVFAWRKHNNSRAIALLLAVHNPKSKKINPTNSEQLFFFIAKILTLIADNKRPVINLEVVVRSKSFEASISFSFRCTSNLGKTTFNKLTQPQKKSNRPEPECCETLSFAASLHWSRNFLSTFALQQRKTDVLLVPHPCWEMAKRRRKTNVHSQTCLHLLYSNMRWIRVRKLNWWKQTQNFAIINLLYGLSRCFLDFYEPNGSDNEVKRRWCYPKGGFSEKISRKFQQASNLFFDFLFAEVVNSNGSWELLVPSTGSTVFSSS